MRMKMDGEKFEMFEIGTVADNTVEVIKWNGDVAEWQRTVMWVEPDTAGDAIQAACNSIDGQLSLKKLTPP